MLYWKHLHIKVFYFLLIKGFTVSAVFLIETIVKRNRFLRVTFFLLGDNEGGKAVVRIILRVLKFALLRF